MVLGPYSIHIHKATLTTGTGWSGGGGGSSTRGRTDSDGAEQRPPIVARPQLTSKACGARLLVSGGGHHVARREDDKCASYGSLFTGQSSGTQVETEAKHDGFSQALRTPVMP